MKKMYFEEIAENKDLLKKVIEKNSQLQSEVYEILSDNNYNFIEHYLYDINIYDYIENISYNDNFNLTSTHNINFIKDLNINVLIDYSAQKEIDFINEHKEKIIDIRDNKLEKYDNGEEIASQEDYDYLDDFISSILEFVSKYCNNFMDLSEEDYECYLEDEVGTQCYKDYYINFDNENESNYVLYYDTTLTLE